VVESNVSLGVLWKQIFCSARKEGRVGSNAVLQLLHYSALAQSVNLSFGITNKHHLHLTDDALSPDFFVFAQRLEWFAYTG
jgi:hypothetical protein